MTKNDETTLIKNAALVNNNNNSNSNSNNSNNSNSSNSHVNSTINNNNTNTSTNSNNQTSPPTIAIAAVSTSNTSQIPTTTTTTTSTTTTTTTAATTTTTTKPPIPSYALDKCLSLLSSNTDENKFVGLLLIKNTIKQDDVDTMYLVYKSLGLSFIARLLQTPPTNKGMYSEKEDESSTKSINIITNINKGEDSISYHTLAINILSTFLTLEYPEDHDPKTSIIYQIITRQSSLLESISKSLFLNIEFYVGQSENINVELIRNAMSILFSILSFESKLKEIKVSEQLQQSQQQQPQSQQDSITYKLPSDIIQNQENIQLLDKYLISLEKSFNIIKKNNNSIKQQKENNNNNDSNYNDNNQFLEMKDLLSTTFVFLQLIVYKMHERNEKKQYIKCGEMLDHLACLFKDIPNEIKFQLLPIFILMFQLDGIPKHISTQSAKHRQSLTYIGQSLYDIFTSREFNKDEFKSDDNSDSSGSREYHDQSIILFSILFDLYGGDWILQLPSSSSSNDTNKMGENLYYLACQHVRTELHIQLLHYPVEDEIAEDRFSVILSCYSILEDVIEHMVAMFEKMESGQGFSLMSADTILKVRNVIIDCNAIMLEYLKSVVDEIPEKEPTQMVIMTTKRVGHFLAEEATLAEELSLSLVPIIEYYLQHRRDYGHFISFLLPGVYNYLLGGDDDDDNGYDFDGKNTDNNMSTLDSQSAENQKSFFYKQHGDVALARFLSSFLVTFVEYIQEPEPQASNHSVYTSMVSYEMTPSTIVGGVIPMSTAILCRYLSEDIRAMSSGDLVSRFKNSFQDNRLTYVSLFLSVSEAIHHLSIFSEATITTSVIGDDYHNRQLVMSNMTVLALSILRHLNEADSFSLDENHNRILTRTIESIVNFYLLLEFPPSDQINLLIWESLKSNWLYGIDLMSQCVDRYPILRDTLTSKRWPPPDFTLSITNNNNNNTNNNNNNPTITNHNPQNSSTTNNNESNNNNNNNNNNVNTASTTNRYNEFLDSITINTVNRSIGNLVRRLIESRN
ncbi:hypothetical protein DFA_01000 [Cavenderia fasciculata]|uniref:Uncharacterized protein n=1 Tax=Cavenderia fasciculata TaxID=261658 RepID=F4PV09_CACFS|nr:uncharacterized protein DFA_01000 [Cavenderia fasciculata]EGG21125.1 hypothetical protein DFA_01000 [Cavenderia fasciculata]|eukprot:XP_004358975.1 hypothetical protein DFA_01000 [Cavenderia fasciculata]